MSLCSKPVVDEVGHATVEGFLSVLEALWAGARESMPTLPEAPAHGEGRMEHGVTFAHWVVDPSNHFFLLQWQVLETSSVVSRTEAFFVTPATGSPKCGLRRWRTDLQGRRRAGGKQNASWVTLVSEGQVGLFEAQRTSPEFSSLYRMWLMFQAPRTMDLNAAGRSAVELQEELDSLRELVAEQSDTLRILRSEVRRLQAERASSPLAQGELPAPAIPDSLRELAAWAAEHENDITILPRALSAARKARFEDIGAVYQALEILAGPYREMRMGLRNKSEVDGLLAAGGFRLSGSTGACVAGEQGDQYFVRWQGRRQFLGMHLAKGGGRDERYCLRIYFFWDDALERVIVGSLPHHLENSLS